MGLFSRKPKGDLNLDYGCVAGHSLAWLPFSKAAISLAFPHLTVKAETIPGYNQGTVEGFALYDGDALEPAFCISRDSDSGYASDLAAYNAQTLSLGRYRVGETCLGDFSDDHLEEAGFWVGGGKIMTMGGQREFGATFGARHLFEPPADWSGDLRKESSEFWKTCVLTETRYFISGRRQRPYPEVDEATGLKLYKKHRKQALTAVQPGPNLCGGNPIPLLIQEIYDPKAAEKAYVKLVDIIRHTADPDTTKAKIKEVFANTDDPETTALRISEIYNQDAEVDFVFWLDWKEDTVELEHILRRVLADVELDFPKPRAATLAMPGALDPYFKYLNELGFDLWAVSTGVDAHAFFVASKKDRNRIKKLMAPTRILAS